MTKALRKTFEARLERMPGRLGWTIIRVPFSVLKIWGSRGMFRVKGGINGFAFRTSLFPTRKGEHILLVNKRMQAGAKARAGTLAQFLLEPDTEKRVAKTPAELARALAEDRSLRRWFDSLSYSIRRWIGDWVSQPKSTDARVRRAEQIAERLLATMEAERELPPLLQLAFARDPRVLEGWKLMSPSRRRGNLLAIFYYRTPEARDRRIAKVMEEAAAVAERKANR